MRRKTAALLLVVLFAAIFVTPTGLVRAGDFTDLTGHWAQAYIIQAIARGYVNGYPDGSFRPDNPVTRVELLRLAQASAGVPPYPGAGSDVYTDLTADHWLVRSGFANPALLRDLTTLWGAVPGQPLGIDQPATRAEAAILITFLQAHGAAPRPGDLAATNAFSDLRSWTSPAKAWLGMAIRLHFVRGFADSTFRPADPVTRAQAVVLVEQAYAAAKAPPAPPAPGRYALAGGYTFSVVVQPDGSVLTWGRNEYGQLGDGYENERLTPAIIPGISQVAGVAAGSMHVLAVRTDGSVWGWGSNYYSQLGLDTKQWGSWTPVQVPGLSRVLAVAASESRSLALDRDGNVWDWGMREDGAWGPANTRKVPEKIAGLDHVVAIAAGPDHSLAARVDGTVWAWGRNDTGQLGDGTFTAHGTPVQVVGLNGITALAAGNGYSLALDVDGNVWEWGTKLLTPQTTSIALPIATAARIPGLSGVTAISLNGRHALAVKSDGTLWSWGENDWGQGGTGVISAHNDVVQVLGLPAMVTAVAAPLHSIAVGQDGSIWAWGDNHNGQLAQSARSLHQFRPTPIPGLSGVKSVAAGNQTSLFLKPDGTAWSSGTDGCGVVSGGKSTADSSTAQQVPGLSDAAALATANGYNLGGLNLYSLALKGDGSLWIWGCDTALDHRTFGHGSAPAPVAGIDQAAAMSAGGGHVLVLGRDGSVWAWGNNDYGQLGDGGASQNRATPAKVAGLPTAAGVAAAGSHSLVLGADGTVWAWGDNQFGQVGDGSKKKQLAPVQVAGLAGIKAVAVSQFRSVALAADGTLWEWGSNLPTGGDQAVYTAPHRLVAPANLVALAGGLEHFLALGQDGSVWTWGWNQDGQLGDGSVTLRADPVQVIPGGAVAVAAAGSHSLALLKDGTVLAWGSNYAGQLADGVPLMLAAPARIRP